MALNSRTAPQKSFGRRPAPPPRASEPEAPAPVLVQEVLRDAQPAPNWLSEITATAPALAPKSAQQPAPCPADDPQTDHQTTDDVPSSLTAGHVVGRSLAVMGKNPVTFLAVLAVIALPEQFIAYLPISAGIPAEIVMPVFTTLACMALYATAFAGALASLKGEKVNLDVCLRAMARTPGSAWASIATTVSCLSLMLILPAIGFAGRWALAAPVAIVEGRAARARSLALTAPNRAQIRLLVLLLAGLTLLRGFLAMAFATSSVMSALTGDWLFPMLLTVFAAVAGAVLYHRLAPSIPMPVTVTPSADIPAASSPD
ncbi:MAG TPA: hypothetical protein VH189_08020 [Rhizomicrobium sp.]|nr:hypothetical protein [Rhizomicrobium sp.]